MRRSFCDFLKEEDKEETEILYKGEKDELTFLQPLQLELGSIMSLIRRFREPISVFLLSSLSLSLSLSASLSLFSRLQSKFLQSNWPDHIHVVTVMLIESQSYLLNSLAHDKFDKLDLTKSSANVTFWDL